MRGWLLTRSGDVHILLVEDNCDHAEFTLRALADANQANRTYWVKDGEEALYFLYHRRRWADPAAAPRPSLIVLDINVPKIDGHGLLRHVKANESLREIPVVMLTTSSKQSEVTASYTAGANGFITKPVDFREFVARIKALSADWVSAEPSAAGQSLRQEA